MSIFITIADLAWKHWRSIALIALLAVAALVAHAWFAARRSAATLAATLAAAQKQVDAAAAGEKTRDAQLATQLAQIAALEKKVQTPAQALAALPGALPPLPLPITLSNAPSAVASVAENALAGSQNAEVGKQSGNAANSAGAQSAASPESPSATSVAVAAGPPAVPSTLAPIVANIPQADLTPLYDYLENCQATTLDDAAARKDFTDEQTEVTALTKERDAAVATSKGGGFWTRLRRGAKWFAIGAATGAVVGSVAVAAHH